MEIQRSLSTVGGVQLRAGGYYWSSTEYGSSRARGVDTSTGGVFGTSVRGNTLGVRPFASLPVSRVGF